MSGSYISLSNRYAAIKKLVIASGTISDEYEGLKKKANYKTPMLIAFGSKADQIGIDIYVSEKICVHIYGCQE